MFSITLMLPKSKIISTGGREVSNSYLRASKEVREATKRYEEATKNSEAVALIRFSRGEFDRMSNIFGTDTAIEYARMNGVSTLQIDLWLMARN